LIAAWLAKEKTFFRDRGTQGAYNALGARRLAVREKRLFGLLGAAGTGKNRRALPILRAMLKTGGVYSREIAIAIGRIGDPGDLERFIAIDKHDRSHKVDLSGFGVMAIDRIMKDVDNPAIPSQDSEAIMGYLGTAVGHETVSRYQTLMRHKNSFVAKSAAEAIARVAEPSDEPLILGMLKDENPVIRRAAIAALEKIWDDKYAPAVITALRDPDDSVGSRAAECLGARRVCLADSALRSAMKDGSNLVRDSAKAALNNLYHWGIEQVARRPHAGRSAAKVERLLKEASEKALDWQRMAAASEIAKDGYPEEVVPLLGDIMLKGTDDVARTAAAHLLREIGGEKAKAELTKALSSPDRFLRKSAADDLAEWIGECGGKPDPSEKSGAQ
jgi:HEAT repeat protein